MFKALKKIFQVLESVRKSPPAKNPHHAETNQSTRNASKLTGFNKMRAQNHRRLQSSSEHHKYFQFHNIH